MLLAQAQQVAMDSWCHISEKEATRERLLQWQMGMGEQFLFTGMDTRRHSLWNVLSAEDREKV
jgi:hypothetical protein